MGELHEPILTFFLLCDKQIIINIALNLVIHFHTKYIEIDQYFVRHNVEDKEIKSAYIQPDSQVADIFTKGLTT